MDTSSVSMQERQSQEAVFRFESTKFPLDKPKSEDVQSLVLFELPVTTSSSGLARPLMELQEGLEDSCLCHLEPVPFSGIKSGVWSLPHAELCSLLTSTSGESFWVFFSWWSLKEPLGGQPYFYWEGPARDSKNEYPMEGATSKGRCSRKGMAEGGFPVSEWDCWRALEQPVPPGQSHPQWLEWLCSVAWQPPVHYWYGEGGTSRKAPGQQLHRLGWTNHWKYFLMGTVSFPGLSWLFLFMCPLHFDPPGIIFALQHFSLFTLLTLQLSLSLIETLQAMMGWIIAWSCIHLHALFEGGGQSLWGHQ